MFLPEPLSLPVPLNLKSSMANHFDQAYKNGTNPTIQNKKLDMKWDTLKPYLDFTNLEGQQDIGVGLFYTLSPNKDYFTYVITKAEKVKGKIEPIPVDNTNYLMILENGQHLVPHSELISNEMSAYKNNVKVKSWPCGSTLNVSGLENHPEVSFFEGNQFYAFISQNIDLTGDTSNYDITIFNGSILHNNIKENGGALLHSIDLQSPLLVIEHNNDDLLDNSFNLTTPYLNKALDVGRLCPPQCD